MVEEDRQYSTEEIPVKEDAVEKDSGPIRTMLVNQEAQNDSHFEKLRLAVEQGSIAVDQIVAVSVGIQQVADIP